MLAALAQVASLFALAAALCVGLLLIVAGTVMLAIDLGDPAVDKARIAVASGASALGLALFITGASSLCHWLIIT
ncbi:hypothetical protein [Sphingomonas sp. PB4P5]|uniref:hypothetical protein n=1 Tax=Parasphingomonas puruogangriensis TaxID=3096155 RepID=UPI002FC5F9EC